MASQDPFADAFATSAANSQAPLCGLVRPVFEVGARELWTAAFAGKRWHLVLTLWTTGFMSRGSAKVINRAVKRALTEDE